MKTREYNEAHIRNGGSVLWKGKIITDVNELPTDAEIAAEDKSRAEEVGAANKANATVASLEAENAKLKAELEAAKKK